jgi:hypothetical protein
MSDEPKAPEAEEYLFAGMGFKLGPASGAGTAVETQADSEKPRLRASHDAPIEIAGRRFATRLQLLWTYVTQIGAAAQTTSFANMAGVLALVDEIVESAKGRAQHDAISLFELSVHVTHKGDKSRKEIKLEAPLFEERHHRAVRERIKYHDAALTILHETAVQQLVNAYEQLMADLLRRHIAVNTSEAAKDQSITYQQLLEFQSLEEAKRHVIETQVTEFIRSKDTLQQFKHFRDHLKIDISSNYPEVALYRELVLRRHAIVHAGGIATPDYIRKLKSIGGFPIPTESAVLKLSPQYVLQGWDVVYSLGVVTFHLLAQTLARRDRDADAEDEADNWLNAAALWAIEQRRYKAAERILKYGNGLHLAKDTCQLMVLINLAQTYKWQGDETKCRELLDTRDWVATNSAFRLCAATLRGDNVEAAMIQAVREEQLSLDQVYEWPVFQELRKQEGFPELLQKAFGTGANRQVEPFPATLLDMSPKTRLDKIFEHLKRTALESGKTVELNDMSPDSPIVH